MKKARRKPPPEPRRPWLHRSLFVALAVLAGAYLALLPWLRRMGAETERLRRDTTARQAETTRLLAEREALAAARTRVERDPSDAAARLDLASRLQQAGQRDEAARHARRAADLLPKDPEPLLLLADIEREARRYDSAVDAYRAVLRLDPGHRRALTALGFLYVSFGWPRDAVVLLQPAVRAAPSSPYLKVALAAAFTQQQEWDAAERLLREARRLAPDEPSVWSPLVHLLRQTRREREAVSVARELLAQQPDNVEVLLELGQAYYHLNDLPRALEALQKALALSPAHAGVHYYLALCHQRAGDRAAAIRELEEVRRLDPDLAQTRLILGRLYLQTGRAAEGRRLLAEFRQAQAREGRRALAELRVANRPRDPAAHWLMALVHRDLGDLPHMRVELRRTLELDPHHHAARRLLQDGPP